ncbi:MAG: acyl--CoA ligase [Rhodobacteraceae bacterium]|nr:acyl--CoA ligase [Paracoccaceae bacterium]
MSLLQWFDDVVERFGDRPAIYTNDGQSITFSRLSHAADQIAVALKEQGVRDGHNVISTLDHLALNTAFWFAVWRLGANVLATKSVSAIEIAGISVDALMCEASDAGSNISRVLVLSPDILSRKIAPFSRAPEGATFFPTINSTRVPGVLEGTGDQLLQDANRYTALIGAATGPIFMTSGLDSMRTFRDIFRAFSNGKPVIGPDMPIEGYWPKIIEHGVVDLFVTPLMLHRLVHAKNRPADTSLIQRIFIGSGTPQIDLLRDAAKIFGPVLEIAAGTPETGVFAFRKFDPASHEIGKTGPIVNGLTAQIEDIDGNILGPNITGRLKLNVPKAQKLKGYIGGRPAYGPDGGFYPGYLATIDENGVMTKLARTDDRLGLGGTRYFSGLIEAAIEHHPTVQKACAIRVFAKDGSEALGIVITPLDGFDPKAVQALAKRSLAGIGEVIVKEHPEIPLLKDGTPDRTSVEEWWAGTGDK